MSQNKDTELSYLINRIEALEGKKIDSINYTDGSATLNLELDTQMLSFVYQRATEKDVTPEQAIVEMVEQGLEMIKMKKVIKHQKKLEEKAKK